MASSEQFEAYVKQNTGKYENDDLAQRDILNVLSRSKDLRPKLDRHVFNDGTSQELMSLAGTIPVLYKARTYNIPICIWMLKTYPYNPPLCFVRPTSTMLIKPSKHVDANGRVYLPYLRDWKANNSDLLSLIEVMTVVFGESSPVYTKEAAQPKPPLSAISLQPKDIHLPPQPKQNDSSTTDPSPATTEEATKSDQHVTELQLLKLSRTFPPEKYFDLCIHLGYRYNEGKAILADSHNDHQKALMDVLIEWNNRSESDHLDKLKAALNASDAGGIIDEVFPNQDKDEAGA